MKAADPLRVAALEQALDNDEDLEEFGDATFRGFADAQFQKIEHAVLNDDDEFTVSSDTFVAPESYVAEECFGTDECHGILV